MIRPAEWKLLETDPDMTARLERQLGFNPTICRLLAQRGLTEVASIQHFFSPAFSDLHDPFLMRDMDAAVDRLDRALQSGERILLYGDYDVDGATSVAMMYAFLSPLSSTLDYYLPDREKEGYGLSLQGVEYAREQCCTLMIVMDCGIKGNEAVALARRYGIDVIICDHHLPEGELPASVANLDPKREDCLYPYKELSGCGIAFKLAQAYALKQNTPVEELHPLLDLVAVSIACDIVPITGENRVLAYLGLQRLNQHPRTGIWALIHSLNRVSPLTVSELVFGLGPTINAAGRLGDARDAVRLLLSNDKNSALLDAQHLAKRNAERRRVDYATADDARNRFRAMPDWKERKSIVLFDPSWHKGIIGISAGRMVDDFHRPAVILTESNGRAVGSARSVRGFDLYAALQHCEDLFYSYGGHSHAAGMQMPVENVSVFAERFEQIVHSTIIPEAEERVLEIAAKMDLAEITPEFWSMLRRFEPFGPSNLSPVFWAEHVLDTGKSRLLDNNHVRLSLRQPGNRQLYQGIGFGLGKDFEKVKDGPFDIAFSLREEYWRGERVISLIIKAVR